MSQFQDVFGAKKPVIAMVHLGASPGTPLYDAERGIDGILAAARADLHALQAAGFDAVMFGNENDRPYELKVDPATSTTMAYVIGRLRDEITVPFWGQCAVGSTGLLCSRRGHRSAVCARNFHWHLCFGYGDLGAGRGCGPALCQSAWRGRCRTALQYFCGICRQP